MKQVNLAIVGATGMVGRTFLKVLEERKFPIKNLYLFSSEKSAGTELVFRGKEYKVEALTEESFDRDIDIALFSAGGDVSKKFAPIARDHGVVVVDNSSAWRMENDVPLVVPEVNPKDVDWNNGIIANPNCSTIQSVVPLTKLHEALKIKRIVYSTYQAVSGSGVGGIKDLENGINGGENKKYPHQIAYNCLPHIDEFLDNGCINWDEDFKKMLDAFLRYVQLGNGFSGDDLSSAELLVHLLKDNGDKGFIDDNLTTVLCSCAIAWVKQNPETIPLLDADYIR